MKKRSTARFVLLALSGAVGLAVVLVVGLLLTAIITDYKPEAELLLETRGNPEADWLLPGLEYSVLTFNIGYCGLGKQEDFFMDGGKNSGAQSENEVLNNLENIYSFVEGSGCEFILLQEVDENAARSHSVNQRERFESLPRYVSTFALNYKAAYVPVPLTDPMGGVTSGIMTLSNTAVKSVKRVAFDGSEPFPKQLFDLDRCFTITRMNVENGKQFVLINAHFSAYDEGGSVRAQQLAQMQKVANEEYSKGNYVIIGGDWNNELPGTDAKNFQWSGDYPDWYMKLPDSFAVQGYSWAVDPSVPTCRDNKTEYIPGESFVVTLDGFLVSDNINIKSTKAYDFGFENSDHNPVIMKFVLEQ